MTVNTLVTHKTLPLGIGCISKVLAKQVVVNWGLTDAKRHNPSVLVTVDVSKCKTLSLQEFRAITMNQVPGEHIVIVGNEVKHYVGIGWVALRTVTAEDLLRYPRLI